MLVSIDLSLTFSVDERQQGMLGVPIGARGGQDEGSSGSHTRPQPHELDFFVREYSAARIRIGSVGCHFTFSFLFSISISISIAIAIPILISFSLTGFRFRFPFLDFPSIIVL